MIWSVQVSPEAEADIQAAYDWYQDKRRGLGEQFLANLRDTFTVLETRPTLFAEIIPDVRALLVDRFPYVAYYVALGEVIHVIGVIHASRDPQVWQSRVPQTTRG